jgi:hypothetical protein
MNMGEHHIEELSSWNAPSVFVKISLESKKQTNVDNLIHMKIFVS